MPKLPENFQDSHMLNITGDILALLVKRYQDAVKRGDPVETLSILRGLRSHVELASMWTKQSIPGEVNGSLVPLEDTAEHSYTA